MSCCHHALSAHLRIQLLLSSRRAFSSSTARRRNGVPPTFHPTSNEPLTTLLSTIRRKIFIPSHLNPAQLDLVYRSQNHELLRTDPVHVTLGPDGATEDIRLEPIDRTKDVPNGWKAVRQALALMSSSSSGGKDNAPEQEQGDTAATAGEDWANFVPLLEGMRTARRHWNVRQWSYIARMAGDAGAAHILLEAARQPERTGLYLYDPRVIRPVLWACREKASREDWSATATAKALAYAEQLFKLMEDKRQGEMALKALRNREIAAIVNSMSLPDVVGVVAELAARRVQALQADEEPADEEVAKAKEHLAAVMLRLVPLLPKVKDLSEASMPELGPASAANYELMRWVPLTNALRLAQSILADAAPERELVNRTLSQLEKNVVEAKESLEANVDGALLEHRKGHIWAQNMVVA